MKNPALAYRQFSIQSSTPLGLVVMLYDGAIAALEGATTAIEARDIPKKCNHLNRAQAIILQLEGTLNFEVGGEVADTLKALYVHARAQMLKANIENSPQILRELIAKLSTVREAWYEADHRPATSPATPASKGPSPAAQYAAQREPEPARSPVASGHESPYASPPAAEPGSWRISA